MTEGTEDLSDPEGTEPGAQAPLDGWGSTSAEPAWTSIAQEGESFSKAGAKADAAADAVAPVAASELAAGSAKSEAGDSNPYAAIPPSETPKPAGRGRRPSSLRVGQDEAQSRPAPTPAPVLPPPRFAPAAAPREAAELPPAEPSAPAGPSLGARAAEFSQQFAALTQDRPEVGLAVAFAGGLLLATIFKRFGRK